MPAPAPLAPATLEQLQRVSTDTITTALMQIGGMRTRAVQHVRPLNPERCRFIGPAYTIRYVPIREDYTDRASPVSPGSRLHGRLDEIAAGSVLMLDMGGDETSGAIGDVIAARLVALGVAGVVADGGMRDVSVIAGMALPVWCRAAAPPPSPRSLLAVDVQQVIGCGGVMVEPNDIVVADANGVAVIPRHLVEQVAEKGVEHEEVEVWIKAQIERGSPLAGLYPPTEDVMAKWRQARGR
ncbi:MAG TPA: ribonuclease activity regulator RraA [Acetobacteraceae bacterium]|nr:ribonuclease activity regulator RraA [Acetobacteraceae bacterium]